MRVGIDARTLFSPVLKGIGVYLQNLIRELLRLDQDTRYVLYYDPRQETLERGPVDPRVQIRPVRISKGDRYHLWEFAALPAAIRRDALDLFHSPANTAPPFLRVPRIITVHDTTLQEMQHRCWQDRLYYRKIQPAIARRAAKIVTVSQVSGQRIRSRMAIPESKIRVIPNGIGSEFRVQESGEILEKLGARYGIGGPYIFNAGGESPWKNAARLIEAFHGARLPLKLVISGIRTESIRSGLLQQIEALSLSGKVIILPYVSAEELIALYNGARFFVYPSLMEGFGFPPLEAMACGTPVAASRSASIPEVSGDAAFYFDGQQAVSIMEALVRMHEDNKLREDLRAKGFQQAARYTWRRTAQWTHELYEEVMREKK